MKFLFNIITLISNFLLRNWAYPCDDQGILEPSHPLFSPYSMLHILQPKSDAPNISYSIQETLAAKDGKYGLSAFLPKHLCSVMEDIPRAYVHDLYLQLLSVYKRLLNYIFAPINHDNDIEGRLLKQDNDIWSPILYDSLNCLLNVSFSESPTFNKAKTFIETKVTAMKLQGFNL